MTEFTVTPIGRVSSGIKGLKEDAWGEIFSRILLDSDYLGALAGLEEFSHAIIVTYLHKAHYKKERHLRRHPHDIDDLPKVGIFSRRATDRPNPIGISTAQVVKVGWDYLDVRGLDAFDKTPVLDIKPYVPQYDRIHSPKTPEWMDMVMSEYY